MNIFSSTKAVLLAAAAMMPLSAIPLAPVAHAQEAASEAPQPKPSRKFNRVYNEGIGTLQSGDAAAIAAAIQSMRSEVKNDDDRYLLGSYLLNAGNKTSDDALKLEGYGILAENALTPNKNKALANYFRGMLLHNAGQKNEASAAFAASSQASVGSGQSEVNIADFYRKSNEHALAVEWMVRGIDKQAAAGQEVPDNWYSFLGSTANASGNAALIHRAMVEIVSRSPRKDYLRDALTLYNRDNDLVNQETLDFLRLLRRQKALHSSRLYSEYVEMADARRYPAEVVAVLDEGFADGTISKSEVTFAESYNDAKSRMAGLRASFDQDERESLSSSNGFLAMLTGDALFSFGEYARAQKMYEAAISKGGIVDNDGRDQTDRARMRLAITKVNQGDIAGAKADFSAISSKHRKAIAEYWLATLGDSAAADTATAS